MAAITVTFEAKFDAIPDEEISTVSLELVAEWIDAIRASTSANEVDRVLLQAGIGPSIRRKAGARLTKSQIVEFYKRAASASSDEMMGLWSRPIRPGALKLICRSVIDAPSLPTALNRLVQVWNLLLDDYALELRKAKSGICIALVPRRADAPVNCFAHILMMKLFHGIASWLAGSEVPVEALDFSYPRPSFFADYAVMFPIAANFDATVTAITFSKETLQAPILRQRPDIRLFLQRAPEDWIFTKSTDHLLALRVRRQLLALPTGLNSSLRSVAVAIGMSPRSLARRLAEGGDNFQALKERLRQDMAMRELASSEITVDALAARLGYSAPTVLHRSFRRWTGLTPTQYRRASRLHSITGGQAPSMSRSASKS